MAFQNYYTACNSKIVLPSFQSFLHPKPQKMANSNMLQLQLTSKIHGLYFTSMLDLPTPTLDLPTPCRSSTPSPNPWFTPLQMSPTSLKTNKLRGGSSNASSGRSSSAACAWSRQNSKTHAEPNERMAAQGL